MGRGIRQVSPSKKNVHSPYSTKLDPQSEQDLLVEGALMVFRNSINALNTRFSLIGHPLRLTLSDVRCW
jgi:hypothetical protein